MRKINEKEFVNFTIIGNGWKFTVNSWKAALREWENMCYGQLIGIKENGETSIIDTK